MELGNVLNKNILEIDTGNGNFLEVIGGIWCSARSRNGEKVCKILWNKINGKTCEKIDEQGANEQKDFNGDLMDNIINEVMMEEDNKRTDLT